MIADIGIGWATVVASAVTGIGVFLGANWSRRAVKQSKTSNGSTQAEIVERLEEKIDDQGETLSTVVLLLSEHLKNHESSWIDSGS